MRFAASIAILAASFLATAALAGPAGADPGTDLVPRNFGPEGPLREGDRVLVDVLFEQGAGAAVADLQQAGARVRHLSRSQQTVTAAVPPADVSALREVPGVAAVSLIPTPVTFGADCGGLKRSEGDTQLLAASARANIGVDGTGVTVGVLSDSFDRDPSAPTRAATDVTTGDLPGPGSPCGSSTAVSVLSDPSGAVTDEGRAMAQIVHDLAPGAAVSFASAFLGESSFAAWIKQLAAQGAKVIVDDILYYEEPFFQDGPVAVAVDEVAAAGVAYFSAAGNTNVRSKAGADVGSWEGPFRNGGACPAALPAGSENCADFNPGAGIDNDFDMLVEPGQEATIDLQWAEPRGGVANDFDAYLLSGGKVIAKSERRNVTSTQRPFEMTGVKNTGGTNATVSLVVNRFSGTGTPRLKFVQFGDARPTESQQSTSAEDTIGPTVFGHAAAEGAIAVGAVPYSSSSAPEAFSSRGPASILYGPVSGTAPAAKLALPKTVAKPDLAATDGGVNTFFGSLVGGQWRFYGTSAAAPHAAAVAALALQANPGASPTQIRAALTGTARPVGAYGPTAVGAGLVDAAAAVNTLALAPTVAITRAPRKLGRSARPSFEFAANRPASFRCLVDGAAFSCSSPFTWPRRLTDGRHTLLVEATDLGGRAGTSPAAAFRVDTKAPRTRIVKHPRKRLVTASRARATFTFRSSEGGSSFRCKLDARAYAKCGKRLALRLPVGPHVLRVKARDRAGNVDRTPAVFRFRVLGAR